MLQAPSPNLSRVCGHGHIKKFWLMQTQKENQMRDQTNKNSVVISSSSSSSSPLYASRASPSSSPSSSSSSVKALDVSQRCSPTHIATHHVNNNITSSRSGYGESSTILLKHSCSSNFSRVINLSLSQRPSSLSLQDNEKAFPHEDSSPEAHVLNTSLSASFSSHSSPSRPSSSNLLSTLEVNPSGHMFLMDELASRNVRNCEEAFLVDGSTSGITLEPNPSSINGYRDSLIHHQIEKSMLSPKPSSDGKIHASKLNEGVHGIGTDSREFRKVSGSEGLCTYNHEENPISAWKIQGVPSIPNNVDKWKTRNVDSSSHMEFSNPGSAQISKACSLCGTTKTPMWRSGPQGPKSLCNACGIRFKKYRCLPGQSEVDLQVPILGNSSSSSLKYLSKPLKRKQNSNTLLTQEVGLKPFSPDVSHHQKKSKWHQLVIKNQVDLLKESPNAWKVSSGPASLKKIYGCLQSRYKNSGPTDDHLTVKRAFAKDEEEAAVLLMHLSCGLVC